MVLQRCLDSSVRLAQREREREREDIGKETNLMPQSPSRSMVRRRLKEKKKETIDFDTQSPLVNSVLLVCTGWTPTHARSYLEVGLTPMISEKKLN